MKNILVVEDHIGIREAYQMLLVKEGYDVTVAEDGSVALEATKTQEFDLILLDMLMPTMDGISFLRLFNAAEHPNTIIIVFSNLQAPDTIKKAMAMGVKRYITKATMPPKEMAAMVKGYLGAV